MYYIGSVFHNISIFKVQLIKFSALRATFPIFATFSTTKGKGLKACTGEGMVFEWQKCTK